MNKEQFFESKIIIKLIFAITLFYYSFAAESHARDMSFEIARKVFSQKMTEYCSTDSASVWKLADREINKLREIDKLPPIYRNKGGRDLFVSVEILQACERLLSRIEIDPYTPPPIDSDLLIFPNIEEKLDEVGFRVAREIQYCLLQYGPEVLEIPALESYFEKIKSLGVEKIFTDEEAQKVVNALKEKVKAEGTHFGAKSVSGIKLIPIDKDSKERYLIHKAPVSVEKRKLVTISPRSAKVQGSKQIVETKSKPEIIRGEKRIIARPKKVTRKVQFGDSEGETKGIGSSSISHRLASTRKAGANLIQLIKNSDISEKIRVLGPEAQIILSWQSVVEAQKQFNEESDYIVRNIPEVIDTSIAFRSCPNFSLLNFKNECAEIIIFRNSQINKGFLEGEQTMFFLKEGNSLITSKHIINTAALELCSIAQEVYLPEIIKNSEIYLERINNVQIQKETEYAEELPVETSVIPSVKSQYPKSRMFELYKKIIRKKGAVPFLNYNDPIWDLLESCTSGECVNEVIYNDLSYWFIPPSHLLSAIFRIASETYTDSLVISDYSVPLNTKVGNSIDPTGGTVLDLCKSYIRNLVSNGKADMVVGGIYSNFDQLLEEICKDVELELNKNESFLSNKRLLISTLYELELGLCGVLGVSPKGRSTEAHDAKSELEILASGPISIEKDIWAIEECGTITYSQLNNLICLGSFFQGFISHLFPNSKESLIPISLFCKALLSIEKDNKDPHDPLVFGTSLAELFFDQGLFGIFPFSSDNTRKSKKITKNLFIEVCKQYQLNLEKNFYIHPHNVADSIEVIYSSRICSAPLFPFLPFDISIFPIEKKLLSSLSQFGCRQDISAILTPGNIQPCVGIQQEIINYLHVIAAIVESFVMNFIDPNKLNTRNIDIPVSSLCTWWRHPVKNPFGMVLINILPFMNNNEVSNYVLRYSILMESINFPAPVRAEKRIEYVYANPQISSNRARDLPSKIIFPEFNPSIDVFNVLEHYLKKDVKISFRQLGDPIGNGEISSLTSEFVAAKCPQLESWQIYLAISFQKSVTAILRMVLSKLNHYDEFNIPIEILCNWVMNQFNKEFEGETIIDASDVGKALEMETNGTLFWMQPTIGAFLVRIFNIWSQTAFALKSGGDIKPSRLNKNKIDLQKMKLLFEKKVTSVIEPTQDPKVINLDEVSLITRLMFNPFVDDTLSLPNPELESKCDNVWVANLMIALRIYFMEFQRRFIDPMFHGVFDPNIMCEVIKEIVKKKLFQYEFGDAFIGVFRDKKWVKNKQIVRILIKNASTWILQTFELQGHPTYDAMQNNAENLLESYKLSLSMESRPIYHSVKFGIEDINEEVLPKLDVTTFPSLSLKSITPFLRSSDPNTYYRNLKDCESLNDAEIRFLVSLSSYLETTSKGLFKTQVPNNSPKRGILEEIQYEFPIGVVCKWWIKVKAVNANPTYSESLVSWASLLSKLVLDFHSRQVNTNPELTMPWKPWFTSPVAEALITGFFNSVNLNVQDGDPIQEIYTGVDDFISQKEIRRVDLIESIFSTDKNYIFSSPFHRSTNELVNMPLSYFDYFHLPSKDYSAISDFLQDGLKRPINHPDIMVGRVTHQIEVNYCTLMAYSMSTNSFSSRLNKIKIAPGNLIESFEKYKSSDLSFKSWLSYLRQSVSNVGISTRTALMLYIAYLKEEARILRINIFDKDMRETAKTQIEGYYSMPINFSKFIQTPPVGFFPIFEINEGQEFSRVKMPNFSQIKPPPLLKFSRFQGRYFRTKMNIKKRETILDDLHEVFPSVWESIGTVINPARKNKGKESNTSPNIILELEVDSKYNCNGLFAWQVNRAIYWAGMLQRYISKGPRLLRDEIKFLREISAKWNLVVRKFQKVNNTNKSNRSINIFDLCFFYKVLNLFHNELSNETNNQTHNPISWEEYHEKLPYYTIHLFISLFLQHYKNLNYTHVVLFFYELLLEERRIMNLKTRIDGIFKTDREKLRAIYHAPLYPEPSELVYPGIFFELEPPLPCSWNKVRRINATVIPIISINAEEIDSEKNSLYIFGQTKSDIPLRDIGALRKTFRELTKGNVLFGLIKNKPFLKSMNPKLIEIISKKLSLFGFDTINQDDKNKNSGITKESSFWGQIAHSYTNGLDWFINYSSIIQESTFFNSLNIVETVFAILKRELKLVSRYSEYFQDPSVFPDFFSVENIFQLFTKISPEITESFVNICINYILQTGPLPGMNRDLSLFYGNPEELNYSEHICKEVVNIWEPNIPFLIRDIRKLFVMEFIRRVKQSDAELGSKLVWPSTSTSLIATEWHLLSNFVTSSTKINSFVGFYENFYFWDPALVLNAFYSQAESFQIFFKLSFTESIILEISKTPLVELGSWISTIYSPLYSRRELITFNTIKELFVSHISSKRMIDVKAIKDIDLNESELLSLFDHCYTWVSETRLLSSEEIIPICSELEVKYGKTMIYIYSNSHKFEFIYHAIGLLAEKHPISKHLSQSEMPSIVADDLEGILNEAILSSGIPPYTKVRDLGISLETIVHYDRNQANFEFLRFAPIEMHKTLKKFKIFLYSESFFLNETIIDNVFKEALELLQLQTKTRIEIKVDPKKSLADLELDCKEWVNNNQDAISVINPRIGQVREHSISVINYPEKHKGILTLDTTTKVGASARDKICRVFSDLIKINYELFSTPKKEKVYNTFISHVNASLRPSGSDKIIGWHSIAVSVNSWAKEFGLEVGESIYLNLIAKLSVKSLSQLSTYSMSDFIRETRIDKINFFFNYENLVKLLIDTAFEMGYLLITVNVPKGELVQIGTERVKFGAIANICVSVIKKLLIQKNMKLIKLRNQSEATHNVNTEEVIGEICKNTLEKNRKMFRNFVESKKNRTQAINELYSRIRAIKKEVASTSFAFVIGQKANIIRRTYV
ncbi:putative Secreted Protein [Cryptosporidium felis]|nr:putative Secreted Protein [Cryptosporidium felis]